MKLNHPLPKSDFQRLFLLALEFEWLNNREESLLELWESTGGDENQKSLVEYLIHQFLYVDSDMSLMFCKQIVHQITEVWDLKPENTLITAVCENSRPDGSQLIIQKLKNQFPFGWHEFDFVNSLPEAAYRLQSNDCLVICDDFIGTGDTLSRKIEYTKKVISQKKVENVRIYAVAFAAMHFATAAISGWNCPMFACRMLPKGISETLTGNRRTIATDIMVKMERLLKPHVGNVYLPHFGYKRSESLFDYEDDNIPNNVFPIFWWKNYTNGNFRKPMFRRV